MQACATANTLDYAVVRTATGGHSASQPDYRFGRLRSFINSAASAAIARPVRSDDVPFFQFAIDQSLVPGYETFSRTLNRLAGMEYAWGEPDKACPTRTTREAASRALYRMLLAQLPAPEPLLQEDGVIGGFWRKGLEYLSVDFGGGWKLSLGLLLWARYLSVRGLGFWPPTCRVGFAD